MSTEVRNKFLKISWFFDKKYLFFEEDAILKFAQDIVLLKIENNKYSKNITVKDEVVMHDIAKDIRCTI